MRPVFTSCSTTAVVPGNFPTMAFAGTTVGYVEWDHCWALMGATIQAKAVALNTPLPTGKTIPRSWPWASKTASGRTTNPHGAAHSAGPPPVYSGYYTLYNTTGSSVLRGPLLGNPVGKTEAPKAHSENSCPCTAGCC